ncbi:MAG: histidinol-phosphate transaminase [Acidobacteriota bacterium]
MKRETTMEITQLIRANIAELEPYQSARERIQEGTLLDANENPYDLEWEGVKLNRYPDPRQRDLRVALARYLGIESDQVLAGVGSDEVLDWVLKVFCLPGRDQVAIAEPTYGMYQVMADIFGITSFRFQLDADFQFRCRSFLESVPPEVKVLFLCSPNNPTGNLLERDEILQVARRWGKVVVVDEAYVEFSEEPSLVEELNALPNLILLRTLSKAFGRAGMRLGYAAASPEIIRTFMKVKAPYNLSSLIMKMGCEVMGDPGPYLAQIGKIRKERERVSTRLKEMKQIEEVFSSQANFLLFRCPKASLVYNQLLEKGIIVRDRSSLENLENCIRVSIGTPAQNELFLGELPRVLESAL